MEYVKTRLPNVKFGWLITQPQSDAFLGQNYKYDSNGTRMTTSSAMYNAVSDASRHAIDYNGIDFVIPTGTAIQELRESSYGEPTNEGYHLKTGIPVLTAGYCFAMTILKYLNPNFKYSAIKNCTYTPISTDDIDANGTFDSSLITSQNILLAKKAAILASQDKFNLRKLY